MSSKNQNLLLARDTEVDDEPCAEVSEDGQEGEGIEQVRAGTSKLSVLVADDFTEEDEKAALAAATPEELASLRVELQSKYGFHDILSKSPLMHAIFQMINDLAHAKSTVLIEGETGTGKEQIARAIHGVAATCPGAFVAVNCAALPETLLESELFGHEKGAFTSAAGKRRGRFEMAQGGVIFLDEVGDMPANMQAKLLRVLQERSFERVGGTQTINVDMRVVAATNRSLKGLVREGKFREDLFYRLNVVKINLPPLCQRPEDIPLLTAHFTGKHSRSGEAAKQITGRALEVLLHYSWPGNIRQLENAIERACVTSRDLFIDVEDLPPDLIAPVAPLRPISIDLERSLAEQVREAVAQIESQYIRKALMKTHGHVGKCARICGLSRRCTSSKIAKYQLDRMQCNG
ncbi:MAG TPA: sigma-54 dependent transcriptional regulator [Gemmataceae bacterium]|jgi:transcriptional regulator with PAS, ATPase and Fis domain|nr:sigma-54 dependent transcriptional regulator [Gemmataceae bacterium]